MNAKPYKVIFSLLILSVVFILGLQAFWIHNFFVQKRDDFNKSIYSALETVTARLRERHNLGTIKQYIAYDPVFALKPNLSGKPKLSGANIQIQVRNDIKELKNTGAIDISSLRKNMKEIVKEDSGVFRVFSKDSSLKIQKSINGSIDTVSKEIRDLMKKMITEIRIADSDERNPDTLKQVIRRVFENKGLFLPFEFALKKVFKKSDETLARSNGYNEEANSFISDLSANKVFSTHNFLFVQFPQQSGYLLSSIKNMLLLSLFFSLIIIGTFYYTLRLIIGQKKLSEIKNDFVNNMTHELKTPIATNSLAIDALSNPLVKNDEEKFKDYIRILKEENKKLNVHVERVLQIALLDKGTLQLVKKSVNIISIIKTAIDQFKLQIIEQKADVNFNTPAEPLVVFGDEQHLQTMFSNLLDNALKYSSQNSIISIEAFRRENEVIISVKDNGIGIAREHHEKIFEKFYRAQGGNLHDVKGFGLGLSYVRSIVEAHGGHISLKSEKGQGSEFIIKLKTNE